MCACVCAYGEEGQSRRSEVPQHSAHLWVSYSTSSHCSLMRTRLANADSETRLRA